MARIRDRFRYGLATQEVLDRLYRTFGLTLYPYYIVYEEASPITRPRVLETEGRFEIRYLTVADAGLLAEHGPEPRPVEAYARALEDGRRGLGLFIDGDLAGYIWFALDRVPVPVYMNDLFQLDDDEAYVFDAYVRPEYRGRGFAPLIRYRIYEELQRLNRTRIYSISFTFNASSRRFKRKLHAQEVELRMLVGIRRWRALDLRISVCGDRSRARRWKVLGPPARSRTNSG